MRTPLPTTLYFEGDSVKKSFTALPAPQLQPKKARKGLMRHRPRLVIMLKDPRAGRVKTRLGADIGMTTAAWWFRHQTQALLRRIDDPRWQTILAIAPDNRLGTRSYPAMFPRMPQGPGGLGDRMARLLRSLPPGPVTIIGGDIPGITPAHIDRAFKKLGGHDAVFGPATDGGYWLVGLHRSRIPATLFDAVRWSTEHALSDSIASLGDQRIALTDTLRDVDTARDLSHGP